MRLWLAIRAFFATLFSANTANQVRQLLIAGPPGSAESTDEKAVKTSAAVPKVPPRPSRSEALTLLAALQREARFVDFIQESLEGLPDAQIGAAVRNVHRDCHAVLNRMFDIQPALEEPEESTVEVPVGFDAGCYHLTGNVTGQPPFRGKLAHRGWQATRCDLPTWKGSPAAAKILAPAEVELA
jgi:hypothetical protein